LLTQQPGDTFSLRLYESSTHSGELASVANSPQSHITRRCTPLLLVLFAALAPAFAASGNDQLMTRDLIAAAAAGDNSRLREILSTDPHLANAHGSNSNPVLFAAAGASQLEAVRLLIELGADPHGQNGGGANVLHHCAWAGAEPAMFDLLVEFDVDREYRTTPSSWTSGGQSIGTPLDVASGESHHDLVIALQARGFRFASEIDGIADGATMLAWNRAFLAADHETIERMLADNPALARSHTASRSVYRGPDGVMLGFSLYLASVHSGDATMVRLLAESGGVPLRNGWDVGTPWPGQNTEVTQVLLDVGFQVNMPSFGIANDENFALMLATGIDVNHRWPGHGGTWLHGAASSPEQILRVFAAIQAGANLNMRTHSGLDDEPMIDAGPDLGGVTPLHNAARAGNAAMVRLLLRHGADPTLRSLSRRTRPEQMTPWSHEGFLWWSKDPQRFSYEAYPGETPLDLARRFSHEECVELLELAGR
jgi:ankyrin repeat protein